MWISSFIICFRIGFPTELYLECMCTCKCTCKHMQTRAFPKSSQLFHSSLVDSFNKLNEINTISQNISPCASNCTPFLICTPFSSNSTEFSITALPLITDINLGKSQPA